MKDGAIRLASNRDQSIKDSKRGLVQAARKCPESYVAVTITDGDIEVSWNAMSRMRLIGALHMAIHAMASGDD